MKTIITSTYLLFFSLCNLQATPVLTFNPDPLALDTIPQGRVQSVTLNGTNNSNHTIHLEDVISQNVGGSNHKFPTQIAPQQKFSISFDLETQYLEGPFTHRVILIETDGTPHVAQVEGVVASPLLFSERILNLDYYRTGDQRQWVIYAYNPQGKAFDLLIDPALSTIFTLNTQKVKLHTSDPTQIREGGNTQGLKLTLSFRDNKKAPPTGAPRSIRHIVSLQSPQFPQIAAELFVVGYWQD